jgi:hypothetical protein
MLSYVIFPLIFLPSGVFRLLSWPPLLLMWENGVNAGVWVLLAGVGSNSGHF